MGKFKIAVVQLSCIPEIDDIIDAANLQRLSIENQEKEFSKINWESIKRNQIKKLCSITTQLAESGVKLIQFPELALTSFFPYLWTGKAEILDRVTDKSNIHESLAKDLFNLAKEKEVCISFGHAEKIGSDYYNSNFIYDCLGKVHIYRKVHIPGFAEFSKDNFFQYELKYFKSSDFGYPVFNLNVVDIFGSMCKMKTGVVICHDRRYNAPYLTYGMKEAEVILCGYNTPDLLSFQKELDSYVYKFHYLPLSAQAVSEGFYILASAKSGKTLGVSQIGGSCIVNPFGEVVQKAEHDGDDILIQEIDLNENRLVRSQKYHNSRARYDLLLKELSQYDAGKLCFTHKYNQR